MRLLILAGLVALALAACVFNEDDGDGDGADLAADDDDDDDGAPDDDADDDTDAGETTVRGNVVDLLIDETADVTTGDETVAIALRDVESHADPIRAAVRKSVVHIEVDGQAIAIECGNYSLPIEAGGVRVDCPVARDVYVNTNEDRWGLVKDARVRVFPASGFLAGDALFVYPVKDQRWLANRTQVDNEPTDDYLPFWKAIYYHAGVDLGGMDRWDEILATVAGRVVGIRGQTMPGYEDTPAAPQTYLGQARVDIVWIEDVRGRLFRYSHLERADPNLRLGSYVNAGERIGYLGNEGASGGWAHLHFEIKDVQPSGLWGTEPSYAYLREGYVAAENPPLLALARPHQYGFAGDAITLDAGKSESFAGEIVSYDWEFTDETTANGETVTRTYDAPGFYTEVLKVTDSEGNVAYDFATVQIVAELDPQITQAVILSEAKDLARPGSRFQSLRFSAPGRDTKSRALAAEHLVYTYLHLAHAPSKNIRPGDKVRFIARVFGIGGGEESWDFDDGSPIETTRSGNWPLRDGYAQKTHVFTQPGDYLVRVERVNKRGEPCVARVWVPVRE